jgi:hypothetical protein
VAEWSKANDSKSFEGQPSVGSNPTLSVLRAHSAGTYLAAAMKRFLATIRFIR